jgi:hypothetical protein
LQQKFPAYGEVECSGSFLHIEYESHIGKKELVYVKRPFSCGSWCFTSPYMVAYSRASDVSYRLNAQC